MSTSDLLPTEVLQILVQRCSIPLLISLQDYDALSVHLDGVCPSEHLSQIHVFLAISLRVQLDRPLNQEFGFLVLAQLDQ